MRYCYKCESCEEYFDVTKALNDETPELCEDCGTPMIRIISKPSIIFKGEGFHVNDYKS